MLNDGQLRHGEFMEITNKGEDNSLKYMIIGAVLVAAFVFIRESFLKPEQAVLPEFTPSFIEVRIETDIFKNGKLEELLPFQKISLPEDIGRENPFAPF